MQSGQGTPLAVLLNSAGIVILPAMNEVSPDKEDQLKARMAALGVAESDLQETFVRSSGPGGQNVNKTSTCVMLRHRPTGLLVKCQTTRHQALNRFLARQQLLDRIETARRAEVQAERSRLEKIRRQKRGRSRAAKQRILADKAHQSAKKTSRRRAPLD